MTKLESEEAEQHAQFMEDVEHARSMLLKAYARGRRHGLREAARLCRRYHEPGLANGILELLEPKEPA